MLRTKIGEVLGPQRHDYVLNHLVNRLPFVEPRMRLYAALGVRLADWKSTTIMLGTRIAAPRLLEIDANTIIGPRCSLDARGAITIGRNVNISGGAMFQTGKHDVDSPTFDAAFLPIVVGDRAWIAQNALVLPGVTIGEGAVVAAGCVVTKDVPPYTVVGGAPARRLRDRTRELTYELTYRRNWL
jgi:acetyltransferase-like isoleucine patch superfamily enzyme